MLVGVINFTMLKLLVILFMIIQSVKAVNNSQQLAIMVTTAQSQQIMDKGLKKVRTWRCELQPPMPHSLLVKVW